MDALFPKGVTSRFLAEAGLGGGSVGGQEKKIVGPVWSLAAATLSPTVLKAEGFVHLAGRFAERLNENKRQASRDVTASGGRVT